MKRSEVAKKLADYFNLKIADAERMTTQDAEDLVSFLETLGMLPPIVKLSQIDAYDNAWDLE